MSDAPSSAPVSTSAAPAASPTLNTADATNVANAITQAAPAKAPEPPKSTKKSYKVKVDGREESLDFDPSNEEDVIKHLQMSKAASKRMQESAEMRKGVQELIEALRTNPLQVLSDPRLQIPDEVRKKLAESIINNEIEELQKSPEQKEKERLQKEYERLKAEVETEKKARETAEFQYLQEQQAVSLDNEISSAIETSGLPKTARTVRYFAEAMKFCLEKGLDLSAKDLMPYIKKQTLSEFKEMISSLPDEEFENWLGKDQISRLRTRRMKTATQNPASNIKATGADVQAKNEKPKEKVRFNDFMRGLGSGKF